MSYISDPLTKQLRTYQDCIACTTSMQAHGPASSEITLVADDQVRIGPNDVSHKGQTTIIIVVRDAQDYIVDYYTFTVQVEDPFCDEEAF